MKTKITNILAVSLFLFLFGVVIVGTIGNMVASGAQERALMELHEREAAIEVELSQNKLKRQNIQSELDLVEKEIIRLREERAEIWNQRNEIINQEIEEPPLEAAASEYVLVVEDSSSKEDTPKKEEDQQGKTDLDKLAYAIRQAETADCTRGYGVEYNNCYGLKNGSIAPCEKIGRNNMCIYEKSEDSTEAFKKVWEIGYGGGFPTRKMAAAWTGSDRPDDWLNNVAHYYYQ